MTTDPFNAIATAIFLLAVLHTFVAARFTSIANRIEKRYELAQRDLPLPHKPSVAGGVLHFFGEIEVVFALWAVALMGAMTMFRGWEAARHYVSDTVNYTEAMFVVVIMALAATRPVVLAAEAALRRLAQLAGGTPASWWLTILIVGPLLGSFITEPAAMTISALLLGRQIYSRNPTRRLKYATLGCLFVNVSIGGTLTHFAAPPVLMVAREWDWGTAFMFSNIGWKAIVSIIASTVVYAVIFRVDLKALSGRPADPEADTLDGNLLPVPWWITLVHILFIVWVVANAHHPALFVGGFLFFLGFARATAPYQDSMELRTPMLVGLFLAGLVIHGGLQQWWIGPLLARLTEVRLFWGATLLTAFNDNALITYLSTLVPNLAPHLKLAVVEGAVVGGGLTVIANAPNPAGQALLARFFDGAISPMGLVLGALLPTLIAAAAFQFL